ncbi:MAG: hypothetical protein PHW60_03335 [Kiritimatiellae bacterium]|nr:hypothetical protein [Kiritimatiellia bacterium]
MEQKVAHITRTQLYDQVWSQPMAKLSKQYGLSDVGLAKICKKYDIPRPPRGYWAQKQNGQTPPIEHLPNPGHNLEFDIHAHDPVMTSPELNDELRKAALDEAIPVPETLRGAHPFVHETLAQLERAELGQNGLVILPKDKECLDVRVSKHNLRRALRIMDGLIKGLESRKYKVYMRDEGVGAIAGIMGFYVPFAIEEILESKQVEKDLGDIKGHYTFRHNAFQSTLAPSGKLRLLIGNSRDYYSSSGLRHRWSDGKKKPLENNLLSMIEGMIAYASYLRECHRQDEERKAKQELEEQKRREEQRRREELAAQILAEQVKIDELSKQAKNWQASQKLREYIIAVRANAMTHGKNIDSGSDLGKWLEWAKQQADRLDPLVESPPSILDRKAEIDDDEKSEQRSIWWQK